jgi:hypothetical protein
MKKQILFRDVRQRAYMDRLSAGLDGLGKGIAKPARKCTVARLREATKNRLLAPRPGAQGTGARKSRVAPFGMTV